MCGHALNITVHERLDRMEERLENYALPDTQKALLEASIRQTEMLSGIWRQNRVDIDAEASWEPETALLEFLHAYLPSRRVMVSGGEWRPQPLLSMGYEVVHPGADSFDAVLTAGDRQPALDPALRGAKMIAVSAGNGDGTELAKRLREAGYPWRIVIHEASGGSAFHAGGRGGPGGTAFFFADHALFAQALTWCSAVLPRTFWSPNRR